MIIDFDDHLRDNPTQKQADHQPAPRDPHKFSQLGQQ
jgi:hypothetical protein